MLTTIVCCKHPLACITDDAVDLKWMHDRPCRQRDTTRASVFPLRRGRNRLCCSLKSRVRLWRQLGQTWHLTSRWLFPIVDLSSATAGTKAKVRQFSMGLGIGIVTPRLYCTDSCLLIGSTGTCRERPVPFRASVHGLPMFWDWLERIVHMRLPYSILYKLQQLTSNQETDFNRRDHSLRLGCWTRFFEISTSTCNSETLSRSRFVPDHCIFSLSQLKLLTCQF